MENAVMVLKAKSDKASLRTMAYQVAQITTKCVELDVKIIDCIVTFGGVKDVLRELKKLDAGKRFDSVIIYSPSQICKDDAEYQAFVDEVQTTLKAGVRYIRSPN